MIRTALLWDRLRGLFQEPDLTFISIFKEYHASARTILKEYFIILLIIIPLILSIHTLFITLAIKLAIKMFLKTLIGMITYLLFLYCLGYIIDEINYRFGIDKIKMYGTKVCFLAALPMFSLLSLSIIPYLGKLIPLISILYHFFLLIKGASIIPIPSISIIPWFLTIITAASLFFGSCLFVITILQKFI